MLLESYLSFSVIFLAIGTGLSAFELITNHRILIIEQQYSAGKTITATLFDSFFQQLLSLHKSKVVIGSRCIGAMGLITSVLIQSLPVLSVALALTICSYALSSKESGSSVHTYLIIALSMFILTVIDVSYVSKVSPLLLTALPMLGYITKGFVQWKNVLLLENLFVMSVFSLFWFIQLPYSWGILGVICIFYIIYAIRYGMTTFFWAMMTSFPFLVYCRMM